MCLRTHRFKKAAEKGDPTGMSRYGLLLKRGGPWGPGDDVAAMTWLKKAAEHEQASPDDMQAAALMYMTGMGTPVDYVEAFRWNLAAVFHESLDGAEMVLAITRNAEQQDGLSLDPSVVWNNAILPDFLTKAEFVNAQVATAALIGLFEEVPAEAVQVHAAAVKALKALGWDPNPPPETLAPYRDYLKDAHELYMLGLAERQSGNHIPAAIFESVTDLLRRCETRKTPEALREQQLETFKSPPWSDALFRIRRSGREFEVVDGRLGSKMIGDEREPKAINMRLPLPSCAELSIGGGGEGIWGMVHPAVKQLCDKAENVNGKVFVGVADNQPTLGPRAPLRSYCLTHLRRSKTNYEIIPTE